MLPWPGPIVTDVLFTVEAGEEFCDQWVADFDRLGVEHQILAGGVSDRRCAVHEDVVPGLVAVGLSLIFLIPRFFSAADFVNGDNDSAVTVPAMLHQRSNFKTPALAGVAESDHFVTLPRKGTCPK